MNLHDLPLELATGPHSAEAEHGVLGSLLGGSSSRRR